MAGVEKRGRPRLPDPKRNIVNARMTRSDFELLTYATNETGDTYSEILRKALRFYVRMMKNKA